jgi:hypothetical protein
MKRAKALAIKSYLQREIVNVATFDNAVSYHEIDFLVPAQRFNINFAYVTQKGLPFVREFILRLINLAPMTKSEVSAFFGFSRREADEAVADLVERGELTLSDNGRLTLTEKSSAYFVEIGDVPRLSTLQESGTSLTFDLATFTCLGKDLPPDKWKAGIAIKVDDESMSKSESLVEKHFQRQFNEIFHKKLLSKSLIQDENDSPTVYTVNSVHKIRQMPLRLSVQFHVDAGGKSVEREDFEVLNSSDFVHERVALELNRLTKPSNFMDIAKAMLEIGDSETIKLFDSKKCSLNLQFLDDLNQLEKNNRKKRTTFLGPIYSAENWRLMQKYLAPILASRIESRVEVAQNSFVWLAPSDPYWSKTNRLLVSVSDFLNKANTKEKQLYSPTIYLPVAGQDDHRSAKQWKQELDPFVECAYGLVEGFLGGNVEILYLEQELVAVIYHMSLPENYPVTLPLGFISTDSELVSTLGRLVKEYIEGRAGHQRKNNCGLVSKFGRTK